jgi:hypothetical protein
MKAIESRATKFIALAAILSLCACATTPAPAPRETSPARALAPPSAAGERAVSQVVRGAFGARELTLRCVVAVKDGVMSVVGLNAMGVRLFTLSYDGKVVRTDKGVTAPDAITPERLLADLQLVFWPLASLQQTLRPAGFELNEPAPGTRRLRRGDRLVAEVHHAGPDPWHGRAWLVNLEFGYTLQIDSEAP